MAKDVFSTDSLVADFGDTPLSEVDVGAEPGADAPGGDDVEIDEIESALDEMAGDEPEEDADEEPEEKKAPKKAAPMQGTADKPYTVKTLPANQFVELPIDGETKVVPLNELANGYMREKTFYQRLNEIDTVKKKAIELGQRAVKREEEVRQNLVEMLNDPESLYEFLSDRFDGTLDKVARKYARQVAEWNKEPGSRERARLERERARWEAERRERAEQQEREAAAAREREAVEAAQRSLKPGFVEGMKAAGYPKMTPELSETIHAIVETKRRINGSIKAEDLKDAVVRATKLVNAKAPEPAPAAKPLEESAKRPSAAAAERKKDNRPVSAKIHDTDFWLRGLRRS